MKSVWKGSINFGLVFIPVAGYPATREEKVSFKQLRKSDPSPIKYKKVAEVDDKEVPAKEIVKGYEYEKGKWVVIEDADFEKVEIESTQTIEITDFVNVSDINPKFFYKPYFLEAQKGGEKAYALLHRALSEIERIGVAKVAIRNREYLAAVKPDGLFLVLELMHFAQEVLEPEDLKDVSGAALAAKELEMAKALIESMTGEWQPEQYENRYKAALMEVIDEKIQNRPHTPKLPQKRAGDVVDLLAVLKSSLEGNRNMKKRPAKPAASASRSTLGLIKPRRLKSAA